MDYEGLTKTLIIKTMKKFDLERVYQEHLDSLIEFNDFKNVSKERFQGYLDEGEFE